MTNKFSCFLTQKGRWLTATLFLLFSLGIGNAWGACDPGTIFKFEVKNSISGTIANGSSVDLSSYVTTTEGSVTAYVNSGKLTIENSKYLKITDRTKAYFICELADGCTLQAGDVITYSIGGQNFRMQAATNSADDDKLAINKPSTAYNSLTITIPSGHDLIGKSSFYLYSASNNGLIKSIEIIRPATITLNATENGGTAVDAVKGIVGDKAVLPHAFKKDNEPLKYYRFKGWYANPTGGEPVANYYAVTGDETFYAQFEDNPVSDVMFSLAMQSSMKPASEVTVKSGTGYVTELDLLQYALISGGAAKLKNSSTSAHAKITTSGQISLAGSNGNVQIDLDFPLQAGDVIAPNVSDKTWITASTTTSKPSTGPNADNSDHKTYTVTAGDGIIGTTSFKLWQGSNATTTTITITRPAPAATYNATFANGGHGTAPTAATGVSSVTLTEITGVDGWKNTGWKADVATKNGSTSVPANTLIENGETITLLENTTFTAQWAQTYAVTYTVGAGSGTAPAAAQYAEGAKFNLPGQGFMVAPSGKVFDGWKAGGTKYAENAEYTMGNDAVEFVAQWKAVPTTLYSLTVTKTSQVNLNNGGAQDDLSDDATIVGGGAYMQNDHANNAQQILGSTKLQFKAGTVTLVMTLTNALKEGDTIKATGLNSEGLCFGVTFDRAGSLDNQLASDASYFIVPEEFEGKTTLYAWRHSGSGTTCASIIIRRPAERPVATTEITLSDLKVNNISLSSDSLAALVSAKSLQLKDEYAVAPVIKFNEHTVITYADSELPATKEKDKVYTVTATENSAGKWEAKQSINSVEYTVTANKVSSAKVYYYDGATKLGEETVAINGSPIHAGDYDDKNLTSFDGWYNNSDLALEHKIADIAALIVTADINVYGKWTNQYATSINIEQWTLTNGAGIGATTKTSALVSAIGSHNFAHNLEWVNKNLELDSLNDDPSKTNRNYAYLGLKVKVGGKMVDFRLQNGQTVKVKFGATGNYPQVALNGGSYEAMSLTDNVWTYTADGADAYISIKTPNTNTVVIKQIMINEDIAAVTLPWRVTYDANGGTCATAEAIWSGAALILPDVTPADADHTFAGWYDEVSGGSLQGVAGASYTPTDNITLHAQFAPVEYAITYDGNGATSGSMTAGAAGWGTLVTPDANAFVKSGNVFSGWVITKTSDGSATGITFSEGKFEMPKYDVTLVAQWDDVSKVVKIVETDVKYESFAEAIAAVGTDQTIQLIQNCSIADTWAIDGIDVTLDLNGQTLTSTKNGDAVAIVNGGKLTIEDGTATVDPTINNSDEINYASGKFTSVKWHINVYDGGEFVMNSGWLVAEEAAVYVEKNCTVTINGGVLESNGNGVVMGDGTPNRDNYVINIHGGLLVGRMVQEGIDAGYVSMVVYHPNIGTLNIDGGKFVSTNGPCIVTRGGATNITDGEIIAKGTAVGKCGNASQNLGAVGIAIDFNSAYPGVANTNVAISGTVDVTGQAGAVQAVYAGATPSAAEVEAIGVSGGTFNTVLSNAVCAEGYVPVTTPNAQGKYTVEPKDGTEIIGVVVTGNTEGTVSGLYKGTASINLNNKKLDNGDYYIYVTLKEGYTFEENDVLIVDVNGKSDLSGGNKALEITTGVGNIDGAVWKSIAVDDYTTGENTISLAGIAPGQTSIGLKRSTNQNAKINGLRVLRPMNPVLKKVTVATVEGTPDNTNHVAIEVPASTTQTQLEAIAYEWVSNNDAWTADPLNAPVATNAWEFGVENTVTFTDKDGDASEYYITVNKAAASSDATLSALTVNGQAVALVDGVYAYDVELPYGTTVAPTVVATAHHAGAVATVDPCTLSGATITVVPESGAGDQQVYTLTFTVAAWEEIIIWDGSYMTALATSPTSETELRWATNGFGSIDSYNTTYGEKSYSKYLPSGGASTGRYMTLTVPAGYVAKFYIVMATHSNTKDRGMFIGSNLVKEPDETSVLELSNNDRDVAVAGMSEIVGAGTWYINPNNSIDFQEIRAYLRKGYARTSMLGNGVYGTVCVDHNVAFEDIYGATFYELVGQEPTYGKIAFDEIISGQLEAGKPYLFQANGDKLILFYGDETAATPDNSGALKGTYVDKTFSVGEADNIYFFRDHALWSAKETGVKILANRAWLDMSAITPATPNPAPGRRRVTMAINGKDTATDFENLDASDQPVKLMINGQLFILRGEKLYDATGRLVK